MYDTKAERDWETYKQKLMKTICKNWEDLCFSSDILVPEILPDIIQLHYPPNLQAIGTEALKYGFLKVNNLKRNTTSLSCYCAQHKIAKLQDGDSLRNF